MNPLLQSVQLALQNATQKDALVYIDKVVDTNAMSLIIYDDSHYILASIRPTTPFYRAE